MALTADALTQPIGELSSDLFPVLPGEVYADAPAKLAALLAVWITQAEAATDDEAAQTEYVYWRAKATLCTRLLAAPTSAAVDGEGSRQYLISQITAICDQADAHRAAYDLIVNPPATEEAGTYATIRTLR